MILHIGNGKTVKKRDIIGIFDLDNVTVRASGKAFIARAAREGRVFYADDDIPRSFLLLAEEDAALGGKEGRARFSGAKKEKTGRVTVMLSHISSPSLVRRATKLLPEE